MKKRLQAHLDKTKYPFGIGYDPIDNGGIFDGALDDIAIYNRALTEPEIAALYDLEQNRACRCLKPRGKLSILR